MIEFHILWKDQPRVGARQSLHDWQRIAANCTDWMKRGHSFTKQTIQARDVFKQPDLWPEHAVNAATQLALGIAWRNSISLKQFKREEVGEVWISFTDEINTLNPAVPLVNMEFKRPPRIPQTEIPGERIIPLDGRHRGARKGANR